LERIGLGRADESLPLRDHSPDAIPVLLDLLKDRDAAVRAYSIQTLGDLGSDAMIAVPALTQRLDDYEVFGFGFTVSDKAREALESILNLPTTAACAVGASAVPNGTGAIAVIALFERRRIAPVQDEEALFRILLGNSQ
jgi:hypothetical protein